MVPVQLSTDDWAVSGHVLLIEDEQDLAELVGWVLEDAGHTVATAQTLDAALAHLQASTFDLVLVDGLSSYRGQAFTNSVTVVRAAGTTPVVLFTGHHHDPQAVRAAGFSDLIAKPFDLDNFTERVRTLLGG